MSAVMAGDWINAEWSLPETDEIVIVACPFAAEPVWLGYHDGETWRLPTGEMVRVSHWQSKPFPPYCVSEMPRDTDHIADVGKKVT